MYRKRKPRKTNKRFKDHVRRTKSINNGYATEDLNFASLLMLKGLQVQDVRLGAKNIGIFYFKHDSRIKSLTTRFLNGNIEGNIAQFLNCRLTLKKTVRQLKRELYKY